MRAAPESVAWSADSPAASLGKPRVKLLTHRRNRANPHDVGQPETALALR